MANVYSKLFGQRKTVSPEPKVTKMIAAHKRPMDSPRRSANMDLPDVTPTVYKNTTHKDLLQEPYIPKKTSYVRPDLEM